jgi:hypothetical protein
VAWIVASIAVGYDEARDRILVVANELLEEEESGDPALGAPSHHARPGGGVREAGGRPHEGEPADLPWCSQPKDPSGHICTRSNGHVVH